MSLNSKRPLTLLCLASYEKGQRFLEEANRQGCRVFLLTSESLQGANWPRESLDDIFYLPDNENEWNLQDMLHAVCHLARTIPFDRIIALDDFDLEKAALLREHLRLPGLGETATRYFRDKLAMRMCAASSGIPVPEFTPTINYEQITQFVDNVPAPWLLKPRLLAGALGIKKYHDRGAVWERIHSLGNQQSFFVLERFVPGHIFHVDSIWFGGRMLFAVASGYGTPPLDVTHGGVFTTQLLERGSQEERALSALNEKVLNAFGLRDGVSHTEFIQAHSGGEFLFLETSARVGGANISELIEAATGLNMWSEWARLEVSAARGETYEPEQTRQDYAGLLVSLTRQEWPDASRFNQPEVVWKMKKRHHLGLVVRSPDRGRVGALLDLYADEVRRDFHAAVPPRDKPRD